MREEGYYWVRCKGEWRVAYWADVLNGWFKSGVTATSMDYDFDEIDERRIVREV